VLLDTLALLWFLMNDSQLGPRARGALDTASGVYVSAASAWETATKVAAGRLEVPEALLAQAVEAGLTWLSIRPEHAWAVRETQGLPDGDPFDRLLVAQAAAEQLTFVTADRAILGATLTPSVTLLDARL